MEPKGSVGMEPKWKQKMQRWSVHYDSMPHTCYATKDCDCNCAGCVANRGFEVKVSAAGICECNHVDCPHCSKRIAQRIMAPTQEGEGIRKSSSYREHLLSSLDDPKEAFHYLVASMHDSPEQAEKALGNIAVANLFRIKLSEPRQSALGEYVPMTFAHKQAHEWNCDCSRGDVQCDFITTHSGGHLCCTWKMGHPDSLLHSLPYNDPPYRVNREWTKLPKPSPSPLEPLPEEQKDKSEGVSDKYFAVSDPPELPINEEFIFWRDEEGDYMIRCQRTGEYLTAEGRTPEDAVWSMRETLAMAASLSPAATELICQHQEREGEECLICHPPAATEGGAEGAREDLAWVASLESAARTAIESYVWDWPKDEVITISPFYKDRVFMAKASPKAILDLIRLVRTPPVERGWISVEQELPPNEPCTNRSAVVLVYGGRSPDTLTPHRRQHL